MPSSGKSKDLLRYHGARLAGIANAFGITPELLYNINQEKIPGPMADPTPGTELKVVTGPFRLRIEKQRGRATLFVGGEPRLDLATWFDAPGRRTAGTTVAFGHWSTLGLLQRPDVIGLDTGCVWGGCLSALRLGADGRHEVIQVACEQAQAPGD